MSSVSRFCLSLYFKAHRSAYYDLLDRVRAKGDWEVWLEFFLTGVKETADQAASAARRIVALFEKDQRRIEALGRHAASVLRVPAHATQSNRLNPCNRSEDRDFRTDGCKVAGAHAAPGHPA